MQKSTVAEANIDKKPWKSIFDSLLKKLSLTISCCRQKTKQLIGHFKKTKDEFAKHGIFFIITVIP